MRTPTQCAHASSSHNLCPYSPKGIPQNLTTHHGVSVVRRGPVRARRSSSGGPSRACGSQRSAQTLRLDHIRPSSIPPAGQERVVSGERGEVSGERACGRVGSLRLVGGCQRALTRSAGAAGGRECMAACEGLVLVQEEAMRLLQCVCLPRSQAAIGRLPAPPPEPT